MKKQPTKKSILLQNYFSLLLFDILEYSATRLCKVKPSFRDLRNTSKIVSKHLEDTLNQKP